MGYLKASPLPPAPIGRLVVDIFVDVRLDPERLVIHICITFVVLCFGNISSGRCNIFTELESSSLV